MFDNIAGRYDFLNRFLSLGVDTLWRRRAVKELAGLRPKAILDVATGTGDLAIAALRLDPERVTGVDISREMLAHGRGPDGYTVAGGDADAANSTHRKVH